MNIAGVIKIHFFKKVMVVIQGIVYVSFFQGVGKQHSVFRKERSNLSVIFKHKVFDKMFYQSFEINNGTLVVLPTNNYFTITG